MRTPIPVEEAQRRWFELLDQVEAGASFVLLEGVQPVARLQPLADLRVQSEAIDSLLAYVATLPRRRQATDP